MSDEATKVPVTVLGGYLGAGKTTALNALLASATERLAVLVNDFGSVGIDAALISGASGGVVELRNGCICCSLADGFVSALLAVTSFEPAPDRLVIEASGVSELTQVASWAHLPGLRLDAVLCLVAADSVRADAADRWVGDLVVGQIQACDVVVVNKVDLVAEDDLDRVCGWLETLSGGAPIVRTSRGVLPAGLVTEPAGRSRAAGEGARPAGAVFVSQSFERAGPVTAAELEALLSALPDSVVRAKALVAAEDDPAASVVGHRVGRRVEVGRDGRWAGGSGRLAVIEVAGRRPAAGGDGGVAETVSGWPGWALTRDHDDGPAGDDSHA